MAQNLLCAENTNTCFSDLLDCNAPDELGIPLSWHHQVNRNRRESFFNNSDDSCKSSLMGLTINSEDRVKEMVEREMKHLPRDDYLKRLRSGDLDMGSRRQAIDWIWKVQAHYSFSALSVCLSMNYLDRFLSVYQLPKGKAWTMQLLAVACLSLAAKMEETNVPLSVDLQVGEPKFVFEAKTIQRMELLVLSTLKWRMQSLTPCSFIDYYLAKIRGNQHLSTSLVTRSLQLILSIIKCIDFLEFRPSEIAAAVAIFVLGEVQAVDVYKAMPCFTHVEEERVLKCVELIKDLSLISGSATTSSGDNVANASASSVPQSPNGVLEAACLSYKSDDTTVGSCANSSHTNTPDTKRRKQTNNNPSQVENKS
ncbi:cyclin d, putative [Ricinus communis]|uniref:B-like cyclin n=1 Tax=Ricinus communis TaxID=3988 RepID=B9SXI2_RICCO|nr:cyclin d, putative [Ricinus communis]|eukprot:XP_002530701.1 cyclin-D4-2 [Ricinus communis]